MPHTLLPAKFDPARSAYWLPTPGQKAAARLPTYWFWALRVSLQDPMNHEPNDASEDPRPPWLFLVASTPSPYPNVPKASFTLGPREAGDTGTVVGRDAELLIHADDGPLATLEKLIHIPIYLHTVPALRMNMYACPPLDFCYYALEEESLRKFIAGVQESLSLAEQYRDHALETYGYDAIKNGWAAPATDAGRMRFGEGLNDPHSYIFDFEVPKSIPCIERGPLVYEELMLYRQLCVDYRWKGVELAVDWVEHMRQVAREGRAVSSTSLISTLPDESCLDPDLRSYAIPLFNDRRKYLERTYDDDYSASVTDSSGVTAHSPWEWGAQSSSEDRPRVWEQLPYHYPICPLTKPKVIAFDLFGTILDRQGAITRALTLIQSRLGDIHTIDMLVARFTTLEALAAHSSREANLPTSLSTLARRALLDLTQELDLCISEHDPLFIDALKYILRPEPYADVEHAVTTLVQRGYKLVCLPVHSETTMQHLRTCIPETFMHHITFWKRYVSLHATAELELLRGFPVFCGALLGRTNRLPDQDIMVVSSSMGRVLHCAVYHLLGTVHVRRPANLEGNVNFVVGTVKMKSTPIPSVVVNGLHELCVKL